MSNSDLLLESNENQICGQIKEILTTARAKAYSAVNFAMVEAYPIRHAQRDQLGWTHYRLIMKAQNNSACNFYIDECVKSNWNTH